MRENMPGLARPVLMVDRSSRPTDTAFSIFSSASKRVSSIMAPLLLIAALCIVAGCHLAPLLLIAALCIVAGCHLAPLLLIAALCIVAGCHLAPLFLVAALCIVAARI